jgi:hypothetical protein
MPAILDHGWALYIQKVASEKLEFGGVISSSRALDMKRKENTTKRHELPVL